MEVLLALLVLLVGFRALAGIAGALLDLVVSMLRIWLSVAMLLVAVLLITLANRCSTEPARPTGMPVSVMRPAAVPADAAPAPRTPEDAPADADAPDLALDPSRNPTLDPTFSTEPEAAAWNTLPEPPVSPERPDPPSIDDPEAARPTHAESGEEAAAEPTPYH